MARTKAYDLRIYRIATKKAEKLKQYIRPSKANPREVYVVGKCPRCEHDIDHIHVLKIEAPRLDYLEQLEADHPADAPPEPALSAPPWGRLLDKELAHGEVEFAMRCDCEVVHPKTPEGKKGCGSRFKVRAKW